MKRTKRVTKSGEVIETIVWEPGENPWIKKVFDTIFASVENDTKEEVPENTDE